MPPALGLPDDHPATDGTPLARRYRLGSLLGEGGMGRVWSGNDDLLGRDIAVKELIFPPGLGERERDELRTRMLREARTAAKLSHPSIVTIYDVTEAYGRPWIIMELVRARPLSELVREGGPLPYATVAEYGAKLLDALTVAHARGVVHRDVKPGNVLVTPSGRVVLTDFGIAVLDGDSTLTRTGVLVGSPAYLAPEVARGQPARSPADLWSLGTTLYAALAGRSPFQRDAPLATLTAVISEDPPMPPAAGPLVPVLEGLLRKDPEERMTAAEAGTVLREITTPRAAPRPAVTRPTVADVPAAAAPTPPNPPAPPPPAAAPEPVAAAASSGGAGAAGSGAARHSARSRGRSRGTTVLAVAAAFAVVLAVTGLTLVLFRVGGTDPDSTPVADTAADVGDAAPEDPQPEDEGAGGGEDEDDAEDVSTEGMRLHEDDTGFSLYVPEDWSADQQGSSVFFRNPDGGYLQVDQTTSPGDDALEDWESQESVTSGNFSGYRLVSLEYADHPALDRYITAADWEFTHTSDQYGTMRAVNRGFHTDDYGYALFLNLPEEEWESVGDDVLDIGTATFEPAG